MVVTHYTGALRTLFYSFVSTAFFGFSFLAVSVSAFFGEPAFFGAKEIVILLPSNKASALLLHILPSHSQNEATILRLVL